MRKHVAPKEGVLRDAARMLRLAASRLERYADTDDQCSSVDLDNPAFRQAQYGRIAEALSNIDAAVARIRPYERPI